MSGLGSVVYAQAKGCIEGCLVVDAFGNDTVVAEERVGNVGSTATEFVDTAIGPDVAAEVEIFLVARVSLCAAEFVYAHIVRGVFNNSAVEVEYRLLGLVHVVVAYRVGDGGHLLEVDTVAEDGEGEAGIAGAVDGLGIAEVNLREAVDGTVVLEVGVTVSLTFYTGNRAHRRVLHDVTCLAVGSLDEGDVSVHTCVTCTHVVLNVHVVRGAAAAILLLFLVNLGTAELHVGLGRTSLAGQEVGTQGDRTGSGCIGRVVLATGSGVVGLGIETVNLRSAAQHFTERAVGSRGDNGDVVGIAEAGCLQAGTQIGVDGGIIAVLTSIGELIEGSS